jgi:leucine dehydrogenase
MMTYQGATAETDSGGANALLLGNPATDKSEAYLRAVGRFVESFKGRLIISPDLGTDAQDFKHIQRETHNTIFGEEIQDNTRPTAQITAYGVYWGIKACAKQVFGSSDLAGRSFAVQGVGNVGKFLVDYLKQEDIKMSVSDLVYDHIKEVEDKYPDVEVVKPSDILFLETDFVVPCGVGGIFTPENIDRLRCKVIAGSALNNFTTVDLVEIVHKKGILFAPPFLISGGDLFLLDRNLKLGKVEEKLEHTKKIYNLMIHILKRAEEEGKSPYAVAKEEAMERYKKIDCIKNIIC